jgi:hypothetical protein
VWAGRFGLKWSAPTLATSGQQGHGTFGAARWPRACCTYAGSMNPRYRRLVIPGALVGLILIVVLAAVLKG